MVTVSEPQTQNSFLGVSFGKLGKASGCRFVSSPIRIFGITGQSILTIGGGGSTGFDGSGVPTFFLVNQNLFFPQIAQMQMRGISK